MYFSGKKTKQFSRKNTNLDKTFENFKRLYLSDAVLTSQRKGFRDISTITKRLAVGLLVPKAFTSTASAEQKSGLFLLPMAVNHTLKTAEARSKEFKRL